MYNKQLTYKSSIGLGLGLTYDEQYNHQMYLSNHTKRFSNDQFLFSILPTYRLNVDRLKIDISLGYYPFKKQPQYDKYSIFQVLALKYFITDRWYASFGINATNLHKANYLEWKIGYAIMKKKRE